MTEKGRFYPPDLGARAITPEQMVLIYLACNKLTLLESVNEKWKLYFRVRWETGIRPSEALNLKAKDIQADHIVVFRLKKRKAKPDLVHIQPLLAQALKDYVLKNNIRGRLFPNTIQAATFMFNRIKKRIGLPSYITLHSFRHGFAMNFLRQLPTDTHSLIALTQLQRLLGHSSLKWVLPYIRADKVETDKAIDRMRF